MKTDTIVLLIFAASIVGLTSGAIIQDIQIAILEQELSALKQEPIQWVTPPDVTIDHEDEVSYIWRQWKQGFGEIQFKVKRRK